MDFSSFKKLTIGGVELKQLFIDGIQVWKSGHTNLVPTSIDVDGSVYNGTGYKENYRISTSSGKESSGGTDGTLTGFIKVQPGDVVRFASKGAVINWFIDNATNIFAYYDTTRATKLGHTRSRNTYCDYAGVCNSTNSVVTEEEYRKKYRITVPNDSSIEWIRICVYGPNGAAGADLIVTVNEEIV